MPVRNTALPSCRIINWCGLIEGSVEWNGIYWAEFWCQSHSILHTFMIRSIISKNHTLDWKWIQTITIPSTLIMQVCGWMLEWHIEQREAREIIQRYFINSDNYTRPSLWSSGQSSWLLTQRSRVRFRPLPDFLSGNESGTGSTQPLWGEMRSYLKEK
jgi:hypothetical protein